MSTTPEKEKEKKKTIRMKHSNCRRSCSWLPPSVSSPGSRLSLPASRGPSPGPQQAQRLPPGFSSGFWSISGTQPGTAILDCTRGAGWGCHCGRPQLQPQPGLPQPPQSSDSFCTNLAILGGWARGPVCRRRQRGAVGGTLTPPARGLRFEEGPIPSLLATPFSFYFGFSWSAGDGSQPLSF